MSPGSGQATQFRYTQTPSKVLHLRNLPWECTEGELVELCTPFGRVVNTMCNVGANRNQAFVEFADLNQAIQMVSYYASSSEPAQVRGKSVYIQYSNRPEITNNKAPGETTGNVLLVTFEGVQPSDVSIDVVHLVFSAFGFVHKIATFEKAAGFQALIQYTDPPTALEAKNQLDGRSIPRYLLPEHVPSCHMRITFSAHKDLSIKFQSHRSRDYTNPYLPVNPTAIEGVTQPPLGADGKPREPESNILLASIGNMQYAVTVDVLYTVFSACGAVQKIAMFENNGAVQALVQYPDIATAAVAKQALEGHCIYDGGYCKLHLTYSRHTDLNIKVNDDKSRDYTATGATIPTVTAHAGDNSAAAAAAASNWQPQGGYYPPAGGYPAVGMAWDPNMPPPAAGAYIPSSSGAASASLYHGSSPLPGPPPGSPYGATGPEASQQQQPPSAQPLYPS